MTEVTNPRFASDPVGNLAGEVLSDLYHAVCGHRPQAVRVYQQDDALLLLLRFEPDAIGTGDSPARSEPMLDAAFLAMTAMIAAAVEARSGRQVFAGNLSLCAERGLAVFAFSVMDEDVVERTGEDLFRLDSGFFSAVADAAPPLRSAS